VASQYTSEVAPADSDRLSEDARILGDRLQLSCAGNIGIGLCTDPEALPDVARLAVEIDDSCAELRSVAIGTR
jgi:hypothetical protein